MKQEPQKRRWTADEGEPPTKIAAIQKSEEDKEPPQVMEGNHE